MLSDVALRARLLKIRYIDTEKATPEPLVRYGFLIESEAELAARTGGEILQLSKTAEETEKPEDPEVGEDPIEILRPHITNESQVRFNIYQLLLIAHDLQ